METSVIPDESVSLTVTAPIVAVADVFDTVMVYVAFFSPLVKVPFRRTVRLNLGGAIKFAVTE
jgi:hypothetical protein